MRAIIMTIRMYVCKKGVVECTHITPITVVVIIRRPGMRTQFGGKGNIQFGVALIRVGCIWRRSPFSVIPA